MYSDVCVFVGRVLYDRFTSMGCLQREVERDGS